ncbi:MAG TPA: hypothetical protein VNQ90_06145 [Chthoniobacteraceae bacterium]|nr:hypothetical protein [Chthoniobacteraceae bacterium]
MKPPLHHPAIMKKQRIKRFLATAALAACALFPLTGSAATIYNATDEFSVANGNPNGVWSYGWMTSGVTTFTAFSDHNATDGWYGGPEGDAWVWINTRGEEQYGVPEGWLSLSMDEGGAVPVLRWTAPQEVSGLVRVSGEFLAGDSASEDLMIFLGDAKTPESTLWSGVNAGAFNLTVNVTPGETVNFAIQGSYYFSNTPVSLTIETIPEPDVVSLFILSDVGLMALHFRRRA